MELPEPVDDREYMNLCSVNNLRISKLSMGRKFFTERALKGQTTRAECLSHIKAETKLLQKTVDVQMVVEGVDKTRNPVLNVMANRINRLYSIIFRLFSIFIEDVRSFMEYHLKFQKFITEDRNMLCSVMSQYHNDPRVYIKVAELICHSKSDVSTARRYFHYGINHHKNYQNLYLADFKLEMQVLMNTNGESLPIALTKYKTYTTHFKGDIKFHFNLIDKALYENFISELQYHMIRDMVLTYDKNILMWQKLANIIYLGYVYEHDIEKIEYDAHSKRRLMVSINAFEVGLRTIKNHEQHKTLYKYYADHLINIWKRTGVMNDSMEDYMNTEMFRVFKSAHSIGAMTNEQYVYWAEFSSKECNPFILANAVKKNSTDSSIWLEILDHYLKFNLFDVANRVLKNSVQALGPISLPLWRTMKNVLEKKKKTEQIQERIIEFYEKAVCCQYNEISYEFMVHYLEWCQNTLNRTYTRGLFKKLKYFNPRIRELYESMMSYEKNHRVENNKVISELYLDMCLKFSLSDTKLWMEGLKFNLEKKNKEAAEKMYKSAASVLSQDLMKNLKREFAKLKEKFRVRIVDGNGVSIVLKINVD